MHPIKHRIIIAVTGASGAIYTKILLEKLETLQDQLDESGLVFSKEAKKVWQHELEDESYLQFSFPVYESNDFFAPFASGSGGFKTMIICPCSMGTLGRIANGTSNNLISRAADVVLKERGKLILLTRETPYNLIHVKNMKKIIEAGGIIYPASPSFYKKPQTINELISPVIDRLLSLAGFEIDIPRWGKKDEH